MGTWSAFYVKDGRDNVIAACKDWLTVAHRSDVSETHGPFPEAIQFHLRRRSPQRLIVGEHSDTWCEVHVDGFYDPNQIAVDSSRNLSTTTVETSAQTTSDAYLLAVYEDGTPKRRLEFAEYQWITQEGDPLNNEPNPLETVDDDDESVRYFHHEAMSAYCDRVFGFEFWRDPARIHKWCDLRSKRRGVWGWLQKR